MTDPVALPSWLIEAYQNRQATLPEWMLAYQRTQWESLLACGMPTRKHERYKYVNLNFMTDHAFQQAQAATAIETLPSTLPAAIRIVFVDGYYVSELSDISALPATMIVCSLQEADTRHTELLKSCWPKAIDVKIYPLAALNAALANDGIFIYIPDSMQLDKPIHLITYSTSQVAQPTMNAATHIIHLGNHAQADFYIEHLSATDHAYFSTTTTHLHMADSAKINWYKLQNENASAKHLSHTFVNQQANSHISAVTLTKGGDFTRDDFVANLTEANASCKTSGYYHLNNAIQFVDHHVDINHLAKNTQSDMLYKGVLNQRATAVFNGKLYVAPNAQKIVAYQANHNLLLSKEAEVYSKPELEIYADDVKCKHGATTGQIDQDALFYLRARGIPYKEAMEILLEGFASDIFERITHPTISAHLQKVAAL